MSDAQDDVRGADAASVEEKATVSVITIPLKWGSVRDVPTIYANQLYVTHAGAEFYLVFGEVVPLLPGDTPTTVDHLDVKPLVKIAVSCDRMDSFVEAININFGRFAELTKREQSGNG